MKTKSNFRKCMTSLIMPIMVSMGKRNLCDMEEASFHPYEDNFKLLKDIVDRNKDTEFGKKHNFDKIKTLEDYQREVPLSTYDDFEPYIERAKNGEKNLLTKSDIIGYSRTSGSSGKPKFIPSTNESIKAYTKYTWTRALGLAAQDLKKQGKKYHAGRGLYGLPSVEDRLPSGLLCSNIAEVLAQKFGSLYEYCLTLPGGKMFNIHNGDYRYCIYRFALEDEDTSFMLCIFLTNFVSQIEYLKEKWQILVKDIEQGTIDESINLKPEVRKNLLNKAHPMPERAAYLRKQFEQGFDETILKRLWPNLSVICGIGTGSFLNAAEKMKKYAKDIPFDYSIYGASEGLLAACYKLNCSDMQLITDSCFYEFIPENAENGEILTLDQLKQGERYEIIITTQSGLYRYRLKDIIEVVGFRNKCPLILFSYRKGQMLNLAGEKFTEENARKAISMFEKQYNVEIPHWIFYEDSSVSPSRYEVIVETDAKLPENADKKLEKIIGECNHRYNFQKDKLDISDLIIKHQIKGTHKEWEKSRINLGASVAQVKDVHTLDNDTKKEFFLSRIED